MSLDKDPLDVGSPPSAAAAGSDLEPTDPNPADVARHVTADTTPSTANGRGWFMELIARLFVGVGFLFIYLGLKKTGTPSDFLKELYQYGMFPEKPAFFVNTTAVVLPWLEIILGLAIVTGRMLRPAALTSAVMLAAFTIAIFLRALSFPEYVAGEIGFTAIRFDCGCGSGVVTVWKKLAQNSALVLLCLPVVFAPDRFGWIGRPRG